MAGTPPPKPRPIEVAAALYQRGDLDRCAYVCTEILKRGQDAGAMELLAAIHYRRGEYDAAEPLLTKAHTLQPRNVHIINSLGLIKRRKRKLDEALRLFRLAMEVDPRYPGAHNNLGNTLKDLKDRPGARKAYESALAINPNFPDALANVAIMEEEAHKLDSARGMAERALNLSPGNPTASLALARVEFREKLHEQAIARLKPFLETQSFSPVDHALAWGVTGQAQEALGNYDEAFAAFEKSNAILYEFDKDTQAQIELAAGAPNIVKRLIAFFETEDPTTWSAPGGLEGADPVFFVGFPRSGTTLIEQILAAHPRLTTFDEHNNLADAIGDFDLMEGGLERLRTLSREEINLHRRAYWGRAIAAGAVIDPAKTVVDKLPMNLAELHLIHRLFPGARIIFALRDPRDVIFSCFEQRFGMNVAMHQFLRLDTAVDYYDNVMHLAALLRAKLPLKIHTIRYEDLIRDFETTARALFEYLELPWDDAVYGYAEKAKKRDISTPSSRQVVQPLYTRSIARWRNYEKHMKPYLPVLNRWAASFGYDRS